MLGIDRSTAWVSHFPFPCVVDGGCARLRVYGYAVKDWTKVPTQKVILGESLV